MHRKKQVQVPKRDGSGHLQDTRRNSTRERTVKPERDFRCGTAAAGRPTPARGVHLRRKVVPWLRTQRVPHGRFRDTEGPRRPRASTGCSARDRRLLVPPGGPWHLGGQTRDLRAGLFRGPMSHSARRLADRVFCFFTWLGGPSATIRPPSGPPPGPSSTSQSALRRTSG